jgi:hypothetical protein
MKPRRVILTLEIESDAPLKTFRIAEGYEIGLRTYEQDGRGRQIPCYAAIKVIQAQANVVKAKP